MRYIAQRLGGETHGQTLDTELPLAGVRRGRALSAPPSGSATVATPVKRLLGPDGLPLLRKWRTAIFPVDDNNNLRGGYVVTNLRPAGQQWQITLAGFTAAAVGQPFLGNETYIGADPTDIFRDIWEDLQGRPDGNIGLEISTITTPVRVGSGPRQVEFSTTEGEDVAFEADDQSRKLNWWSTFDCGREIDNLSAGTPFDWRERHIWNDDRPGGIGHLVDLGYPTLGRRRPKQYLVYRENVVTPPESQDNPDYCTDVIVLGAGAGKDRIRGYAGTERDGVSRYRTIEDSDIHSVGQANARASEELANSRDRYIVETVVIDRHDHCDIDALEPGDELPYYAETETVTLDQWVRVVNIEHEDDNPDRITATVVTV